MSYATRDDVKALFRHFADNADAAVTDAKLDEFLASSSAYIDSRLSGLYQLPITVLNNPESFKILKQIDAFKVASIVDDILNNYTNDDKKPNWDKRACAMLDEIAPMRNEKGVQLEPRSKLIDATYLGTNQQKGRVKISSTNTSIFTKGGNNW